MSGLPQLVMRRPHLRRLPEPQMAVGYRARDARREEGADWGRVLAAAFDRDPASFDFERMMVRDSAYRPERIKVVVDDADTVVATASCWVDARFGSDNAVLHWVGTDPAHAGKRLGYEVSLAALQQAQRENRGACLLLTDDERTAAIRTYLRLGFVPVLTHASHAGRWRDALQQQPGFERHLALLDGPLELVGPASAR